MESITNCSLVPSYFVRVERKYVLRGIKHEMIISENLLNTLGYVGGITFLACFLKRQITQFEKRVYQNAAQGNVETNFHDKCVINLQSIPGVA